MHPVKGSSKRPKNSKIKNLFIFMPPVKVIHGIELL